MAQRRHAFTLIELLVVIGIIGLIVAMSVPAFAHYGQQMRLKTATRELVGLLSLARSSAISARATRTVRIDGATREAVIEETLQAAEPEVVHLPTTLTVTIQMKGQAEPSGEGLVIFKPSGALTGGSVTITLASEAKQQMILVSGPTGAVTLQ